MFAQNLIIKDNNTSSIFQQTLFKTLIDDFIKKMHWQKIIICQFEKIEKKMYKFYTEFILKEL